MKIKKFDITLLLLIVAVVVTLLLVIRKINIIQFIAVSMVLSVLWSWLNAHLLVSATFRYKMFKTVVIMLSSILFVFLFYNVLWRYIPMAIIESNTHFGPSESVTFNSELNLGIYIANVIQQFVVTTVIYFIIKYIRKLKN